MLASLRRPASRLTIAHVTLIALVGLAAMAFPATPLPITVELYIDGAWVDITTDVRGASDIVITRGRADWGRSVEHGTAKLTIENTNGKYSSRNPNSTNFGKLTRNTPLRVKVGSDVRFVGEVPEWAARWDSTGRDIVVEVEACGVLRRLTQGARKLQSSMSRYWNTITSPAPLAWWPLEDASGSTKAASGLVGGSPMIVDGTVDFGVSNDFKSTGIQTLGTASVVSLAQGASLTGPVPTATAPATPQWGVVVSFRVDAPLQGDDIALLRWITPGGSFYTWDLIQTTTGHTIVKGYDTAGVATTVLDWATYLVDWTEYKVVGLDEGGTFRTALLVGGVSRATDVGRVGTLANITQVLANPLQAVVANSPVPDRTFDNDLQIGQIVVHPEYAALPLTFFGVVDPENGETIGPFYDNDKEAARTRIKRLCAEEGVTVDGGTDGFETTKMGGQGLGTLVELLQGCADADQGILYESRTALGLAYRSRGSLYDQASGLDLDYTANDLSGELRPVDDDQELWNDVTVEKVAGLSARATLTSGALSTAVPPDGVGVYDRGALSLVLNNDDQPIQAANWVLHMGTWDEARYPVLQVETARSRWTGSAVRTAQAAALDTGSLITLTNLPAAGRGIDALVALLVEGYTETLGTYKRDFSWNLTPGWPWEVWQLETGGSTLAKAVNTSATSLKLDTSTGPAWESTRVPYHLQIDGEAMTVTAMSTDTPTFVAAGTIAHGVNASVTPGLPAGHAEGDLLLVWAAIRNSGTGTVDTPSGYTLLADASNARLFGKYDNGAEAAPTVSFTGGVANADTSARMVAFRGASLTIDASATQLNGSAQDIAYPALDVRRTNNVIIIAGWKQDDWTSVATLAGFTEDMDNSTTTGDDQGIVLDHRIDTTATDITAGSLVVTGGASAISRSIVVALRPLQTATVTRAVNGVSKSLAVGKTAKGWRLGVTAL